MSFIPRSVISSSFKLTVAFFLSRLSPVRSVEIGEVEAAGFSNCLSPGLARVGRAMGAVRCFLACSRHHHHQHPQPIKNEADIHNQPEAAIANDIARVDDSIVAAGHRVPLAASEVIRRSQRHEAGADQATSASAGNGGGDDDDDGDDDAQVDNAMSIMVAAELRAVLRHLQVRWQLFNESLARFHDPEAMLANCTDNVTWQTAGGEVFHGKSKHLLSVLQCLSERNLSLYVKIERLTRVTPAGTLDFSLDCRSGRCMILGNGCHVWRVMSTALETMLSLRHHHHPNAHNGNDNDIGHNPPPHHHLNAGASSSDNTGRQFWILADDNYILRDIHGDVVEDGKRAVLWEQHSSTWYIRGYLSYPPKGS